MIVIRVELWPWGDGGNARELCSLRVVNTVDHEDRPAKGNYEVSLRTAKNPRLYKVGALRDYDRSQHVMELVSQAARLAIEWLHHHPSRPRDEDSEET